MTETVLERIVELLERGGRQASPDQVAPVAVLWPDPENEFRGIVTRLAAAVELVRLGTYDPAARTGPGIWVRCVLAGTAPAWDATEEGPLVVYLPGYSRDQIRDIAGGPDELRPLADLQFRGIVWLQRNGKEWTARAMLGSASGLDLDLAKDGATRDALHRAFPRLLDEPIVELRRRGELTAHFFNALLAPDHERLLLLWLNDPAGTESGTDPVQWSAFRDTCRDTYGFDPEEDGPVTGARLLGERRGSWGKVWAVFADVPQRYPVIPSRLRAAQPEGMVPDPPDSWPIVNDQAEENLREALARFDRLTVAEASAKVRDLDDSHGERRGWVWARLGMAPLAQALEHLVDLADRCAAPLGGLSADEIAIAYAEEGWRTDRAAMQALAAIEPGPDGEAVGVAVRALYEAWLDVSARALQQAFAKEPPKIRHDDYPEETCVLFIDGLRFDVATMVMEELGDMAHAELGWRYSAIPTVTPTAKPAVSPVAGLLYPGPKLSPAASEGGVALTIEGLRKVLDGAGWQVLGDGGWGDVAGRGWIEGGDIDTQGHNLPLKLPHRIQSEARQIAEQIRELLAWGWRKVVVVTDHGWLHLPGGLPKVELPINTAELRKGRCARIPENAKVDHLTLSWRWDPSVRIAVAPGIACYEAGKVYEHGGVSPQECVTPHLVVEAVAAAVPVSAASIRSVGWTGMRCRIQAEGPAGAMVDIRIKPADSASSVVRERTVLAGGKCSLMVPNDRLEGHAAVVVVIDDRGTVLAQRHTTIAGDEG
jgi:hypothetical protein